MVLETSITWNLMSWKKIGDNDNYHEIDPVDGKFDEKTLQGLSINSRDMYQYSPDGKYMYILKSWILMRIRKGYTPLAVGESKKMHYSETHTLDLDSNALNRPSESGRPDLKGLKFSVVALEHGYYKVTRH